MAMPQIATDTERHPPESHERGANGVPAIHIPTDDPAEALRFCRGSAATWPG
jgi:hypothetical protein